MTTEADIRAAMAEGEREDHAIVDRWPSARSHRYQRSLAEAFADERAAAIEHAHLTLWTRAKRAVSEWLA